ncbi:MAG TPA: PQQ-binding-like beta-propeller repeat protein [Roseiflexaceae bacterium]
MNSTGYQPTWSQFGRYELIGEIGRGGMGVVYRAYEPTLDRPVALKVIAPDLAHDPGFVARLRREAVSAARLRHANIALLYEFGQADGAAFLAMEYVGGPSLRQILEAGPLDPQRALNILDQIAQALEYAHKLGIVHRDVKPSNILVGPGDRAVLIDFGLAEMADDPLLTGDGELLGTPHYMAPEQARGAGADARSDQYALAAVAYELLTGTPLFQGRAATAIVHAQIYETPAPPTERNPTLPAAANDVLLRALAKAPHDRFPSLPAFVADLRAALAPPAPRPRFGRRWLLVAAAALALAALVVLLALRSAADAPYARGSGAARSGVPLPRQVVWSYTPSLVGGPAPVVMNGNVVVGTLDGTLIALRSDGGELRWHRGGGAEILGAPSAGRDKIFVGASDGSVLGLSPGSGGTIWRRPVIGAVSLAPTLADDRLIVTTDKGYLYVLQADNGQVIWSRPLESGLRVAAAREGWIVASAGATLFTLDARNGVVEWKFQAASAITTPPTIAGDLVLFGTERGVLYGLRIADGGERLNVQLRGGLIAAPMDGRDNFYVADLSGRLTAISADSGREIWHFDAGAAIGATPLLADGKLLFGANNGAFYALEARSGRVLGQLPLSGSVTTPCTLADGLIFVRADRVYAVGS